MDPESKALADLVAKEEIRELVLLYSRGVDRKDGALLRTLYAEGSTDSHDVTFDGTAEDYIAFLERSFPYMPYSGHHVCNHTISVDGERGEGEVYAIAIHVIPDRSGGWLEDFMCVRYIDQYCKEAGRWRFAKRVVKYDYRAQRPIAAPENASTDGPSDLSYKVLGSRLFQRGPRV